MRWNKNKMRENYKKVPLYLFSSRKMCPICNEKVNPKEETFYKSKCNPYIRCFNKFYWVHKECFFVMYEGMTETIEENKDEYMVEVL